MPQISVIIPTHNPNGEMLRKVLEALQAQSLNQSRWGLVIVDNRSSPPVNREKVARHFPDAIVVQESRLGLTYARQAGFAALKSDFIVLVDDDNVLAQDYLSNAIGFLERNPEVGLCGGKIIGEFETPPPPWAIPNLQLLALRDHGPSELISNSWHEGSKEYDYFAPLGAGLVARAEVATAYFDWVGKTGDHLTDRKGASLASGGDCEIVMCALRNGWRIAYTPELKLNHLIPARRLQMDYLSRLSYESQISWGTFLRREGLIRSIPRWTLPFRMVKALLRCRAWRRSGYIKWRGLCGFYRGQATHITQNQEASDR